MWLEAPPIVLPEAETTGARQIYSRGVSFYKRLVKRFAELMDFVSDN
jgi:hypothetical protein